MAARLVGRTYLADLGQLRVRLTYDSATAMTFTVLTGAGLAPDGHTETVEVAITDIRPDVYLVSWREDSGATVVHVEDVANATLHSTVTIDTRLYRLTGTFTEE
jgi:hypothetical protein